jgi:hypothetical protein
MPDERTISELIKIYGDTAKRIKKTVLNPPGDASAPVSRARAASLYHQVQQEVQTLKGQGNLWTGKAISKSVQQGLDEGKTQAEEAGIRPADSLLQGDFNVINHRAVEAFAKDTIGDITKNADMMLRQAKATIDKISDIGLSVRDVNQILAGRSIIEGKPVEAIKVLRDKLEAIHGETVPVLCKDGVTRNYQAADVAERLARTKTRQAVVNSKHDVFGEMGIELVKVIGRLTRYFCTDYVGHIYSIEPGHKKFPWLGDLRCQGVSPPGPPFHPNCSKSTIPYIQGLTKEGFAGGSVSRRIAQ